MLVAQVGLTQALSALWDSQRQLPLSGTAGAGFFPRISIKLWDSRVPATGPTYTAAENDLKILKVLPPSRIQILRETEGSPPDFAPYGMPVK